MNVGKAIYAILSTDAGVTALASTRIYPDYSIQNPTLPYVVYQATRNNPSNTKDGASKLDTIELEVDIWGSTYTSAQDLSEAVRTALDFITGGTYGNVKVGDAFTIAGVFEIHLITKQSTGQLKTFRVVAIASGTDMVITPPIISATTGPTDAALQYQNCKIASGATAAPLNWLNTGATSINCFWQKDALEILPGRYAVPSDAGTAVMRASTDQGIELVMQKFYDIDSMTTKYRLDTLFGVVNKQPEMSGILLFNQ